MKKIRKSVFLRVALIAIAAAILTAVPAFAGGGKDKAGGEKKLTIGFAVAALNTNSIWIDIRRNYEALCKEKDYRLLTGDLQNGAPDAIKFLENCKTAKADVVILQNITPEAYEDLLKDLKAQGAVLIALERRSPYADYNAEIPNAEAGRTLGRAAGEWVKANPGSKKVAICTYTGIQELIERGDGIEAGFKETCPEGQVVYKADAGFVEQGVKMGEALIQAHPDIQAVMGINDSGPFGAGEAFKAAGWTFKDHPIGLFGIDNSADAQRALKEGGMFQATLDMDLVGAYNQLYELGVAKALTGAYDESKKIMYPPLKLIYQKDVK
ncbi:MAG: sugar ABC transporter substrate-binding protein [Spirochaetaceae bacterium]|jgi:ABC-type sugar transport system substrate-binding protein|nr:sugar ABC transporter substrate-binding protein [Spirochaetaceae bacterium]